MASSGVGDFYPSVDQLVRDASLSMEGGEVDRALRLPLEFVQKVIRDPRTVARIFADRSLDIFCRDLGSRVLAAMGRVDATSEGATGGVNHVFLATELYATGGHTAVVEDLLKIKCFDGQPIILLTNVLGTAKLDVIARRFEPYGVIIECAPDGTLESRLLWTLRRLRALRPAQLLLFNHHQDSVAVAAAQPGIAGKTVFYHHADHHLCLGATLEYDLHVDPSPMGYHNCRDQLGLTHNAYWPLTAEDRGVPEGFERKLSTSGKLRTCSSGTRNKFEQPYLFQYGQLVPELLATTQGTHVHIGLLSDSTLAQIADGMRSAGIPSDRFTYFEWVPSVWEAIVNENVDLYLSSFPVSGARAIVEAMGSGTPTIAHESYVSRFHGAGDMLYCQAFSWRTSAELLDHVRRLSVEKLQEESRMARTRYEEMHTLEALRKAVLAWHDARPAPPLRPYRPDPLQIFLDDMQVADSETPEHVAMRNEIVALRSELRSATAMLSSIYASHSWRMLGGVRWLASRLRSAGWKS
ncbi:hypothetical protein [Burkholderia stagnalis]|uniref:hypothetical protein n=1 Tax=Burkholderia stagnalis TaxID=1503054 RepID=UPI000756C726|nr:hypothetical protein [Burkholderia stagnalis]KVO55709.1 hypothetical protein WT18_21020 [Burkholderia stagnalis]KVP16339.1 hypothetical protein WT20_03750 [Burkholderia stagnalis]KVW94412.1 hypothetical protein WT30_16390 [Burkholderia stagnalis]KWH78068.1 hypothetical protein WT66_15530 [Burkholderia stagnalis]KWK19235.1 hypothetical protein WT77_00525 [Burkholderia stagnalis]